MENNQRTPLNDAHISSKVGVVSSPTPKRTEDIKKLARENPEKMDEILKAWASEVAKKVRDYFSSQENSVSKMSKEKIAVLLSKIESQSVEGLSYFFKQASEGNLVGEHDPFSVSKVNIGATIEVSHKGIHSEINFKLLFPQFDSEAKFEFGVREKSKGVEKFNISNWHRTIPLDLRGLGIGTWFEKIAEEAARRAGVKELSFVSFENYNSVIFPLTQGYVCEREKDKEQALEILTHVYENPWEYNNRRKGRLNGNIEFIKLIA